MERNKYNKKYFILSICMGFEILMMEFANKDVITTGLRNYNERPVDVLNKIEFKRSPMFSKGSLLIENNKYR